MIAASAGRARAGGRRAGSTRPTRSSGTARSTSSIAPNAAENRIAATLAIENERTRSIAGSTIGDGCRGAARGEQRDARDGGRERAERARVVPAPLGRLDEAERERADGRGEQRGAEPVGPALGDRGRGSRSAAGAPRHSAQAPTGRLTKNTSRQSTCTSRPPSGGPAAAAAAPTPAQMPIAAGRSRGSNSGSSSASEVGTSSAAPAACRTRAATSSVTDGASPHSAEPSTNSARPPRKPRRRPVRSAQAPGRHEQRREDDRVGVQHPGQLADARAAEVGPDVRERDVDDEEVEARHERGDGDQGEDLPASLHFARTVHRYWQNASDTR